MSAVQVKNKQVSVKIEANLYEVDFPVLLLLKKKSGQGFRHFIASAIPDDDGEVDFYLAVFVARRHLIDYLSDQCDLRFLFAHASGRSFYKITNINPSADGNVFMREFDGEIEDRMLPEPSFFASSHTSTHGLLFATGVEQKLLIDGRWDMQEFGGFYQKFTDIYSFGQAIDYIKKKNDQKIEAVRKAIRSKPFKGGSSYMGVFNDLFEIIPHMERPSLKGIEYHSPGYVELRGNDEILDSVRESIDAFLENADAITRAHDDLRSFMSKSNLLAITGAARQVDAGVIKQLLVLIEVFFSKLPVDGKDEIREIVGDNPVVVAKIGLAIFRRLRGTSHFFAQGRLAYTE